jgi:hypothetical protein
MAGRFSFSGHETFPLRFSWLTKAVEAIEDNPFILSSDEAIATFGVGKNMVRSIKHWCKATGVIREADARGEVEVTPLGRYLFGQDGADPYCEDPATLWLLHWLLCRDAERCTLWHYVFGYWRGEALELGTLLPALTQWLEARDTEPPSTTTLRRDFQCLVNTYAPSGSSRRDLERIAGCPLASLGVVREHQGLYYLQNGFRAALPPAVFAYAVLDHWQRHAAGSETLALDAVLVERASPGQIFLLNESQAFDLVAAVEAFDEPPFSYRDSAGIRQLYRTNPDASPSDMLAAHYGLPFHAPDATTYA